MKYFTIFLFFFSSFIMNAQQNLIQNINVLSFNLLQQINKTEGHKNTFISAYSIYNAMTMAYLGTKAETKSEIEKVLFPGQNTTDIVLDLKKLKQNLLFNRKIKFYSANNIWIAQNIELKKRYLKDVKEVFNTKIQQANFSNPQSVEQTRQNINQWVENKTEHKIKDFINKGALNEFTNLVLINAIYYYAKWKIQFDKKNTYQDIFESINAKTKTKYMHSVFSINYYKNHELAAIEIPYENNEASFIIIMPDDFEKFAQKMDNNYFEKINTAFKTEKVDISIPKFKEEGCYDLIKYFKNMGITYLFNSKADLSGMSTHNEIQISHILHKALIEVDESGTEAGAATAVIATRSVSANKKTLVFKANKAFFYFIKENSTGTILFAGSYVRVE